MIKTMKKTNSIYGTISKSGGVMLYNSAHGMIHVFCSKASESNLRIFPNEKYRLDVDTNSGNSRTFGESPKVGHILPNGSELLVSVKNDRIFYNIPKGWKKL